MAEEKRITPEERPSEKVADLSELEAALQSGLALLGGEAGAQRPGEPGEPREQKEQGKQSLAAAIQQPIEITVREDGVYASIPVAWVDKVDLSMLYRELARRKITDVDGRAIRQLLEARDGLPVKIAELNPSEVRDAQAVVTVSDDGLAAYLEIVPALGGKPLTREAVEAALAEAGVTYGINWSQVEVALQQQEFPHRYVVAAGKPPVDGKDAYLEYRFSLDKKASRPVELEDGRVDFYNLQLVQNVQKGDVLAVKIPPQAGIPGMTVRGQPIPPKPGKDIKLPRGKNVEVSEDETQLIAGTAGQVVVSNGKIHVLPIYEVHGDVDFTTGNIDFVGSVVVQGNVHSGFTVRAQGNIEVRGSVEAANLFAGGDVVLLRGMQGGDRGQIVAGKNVVARFLEHAIVQAGEEVLVEEAILYSQVQAGRKIDVRGKRGRIVGGLLRAGELVRAKVIGSKLATKTEIEVGIQPEHREELNKLNASLAEKERQLDQLNKALNTLKNALAAGKIFSEEETARMQKILKTHAFLRDEIVELRKRKEQLDALLSSDPRGRVQASEVMYPGVKVTIGHTTHLVKDELAKVMFYLADGEIREGTAL
ncbi:MAG: FapA family protein [Bacillota bacterium]|nr:FapA family protein [Bacillota bacterium]